MALIILLDQFTRNIFRGTTRAFSGDSRAVKLARRGQTSGIFDDLPLIQQVFALMPLEHSELLSDQILCVQGMGRLIELAPDEDKPRFQSFVNYALEHKEIIRALSIPHRNAVMSRVSTDNERSFPPRKNLRTECRDTVEIYSPRQVAQTILADSPLTAVSSE